jgi:hypothetical protein
MRRGDAGVEQPDLDLPDKPPSLPRLQWRTPEERVELSHTPAWARSTQDALYHCVPEPAFECPQKFSNPGARARPGMRSHFSGSLCCVCGQT